MEERARAADHSPRTLGRRTKALRAGRRASPFAQHRSRRDALARHPQFVRCERLARRSEDARWSHVATASAHSSHDAAPITSPQSRPSGGVRRAAKRSSFGSNGHGRQGIGRYRCYGNRANEEHEICGPTIVGVNVARITPTWHRAHDRAPSPGQARRRSRPRPAGTRQVTGRAWRRPPRAASDHQVVYRRTR
jgi:hypothetical protein